MVNVREGFLGSITVLDKDGYGTITASGSRVVNAQNPIDSQDLVTKDYLESHGGAGTWAAALAGGTTTDGYNPEISNGDRIQAESGYDLTLYTSNSGDIILNATGADGYIILQRSGVEVARWDGSGSERMLMGTQVVQLADAGGSNYDYIKTPDDAFVGLQISTGDSASIPVGNIKVISGSVSTGSSNSGDMWFTSGASASGRSGNITLGSGDSSGNTSGNISLTSGTAYSTSGNVTIGSGTLTDDGNVGSLTLSTGDNPNTGNIGNLTISAGASSTGFGGSLYISSGDGDYSSGILSITGGSSASGSAQDISITAGSGVSTAGGIGITAGSASDDVGGDVSIGAGNGTTIGGNIGLITGTADGYGVGGGITLLARGSDYGNSGAISITTSDGGSLVDGTGGSEEYVFAGSGGDLYIAAGDGGDSVDGEYYTQPGNGGRITLRSGVQGSYPGEVPQLAEDGYISFFNGDNEVARFYDNTLLFQSPGRIVSGGYMNIEATSALYFRIDDNLKGTFDSGGLTCGAIDGCGSIGWLSASATGAGSSIAVYGQDAKPTGVDVDGGSVSIYGGASGTGSGADGGFVSLIAGDATGNGGEALLKAGAGGSSSALRHGGSAIVQAGAGLGPGPGGSVKLRQGDETTIIEIDDTGLGFFGVNPVVQPDIDGYVHSSGAASVITAGELLGLWTDSTNSNGPLEIGESADPGTPASGKWYLWVDESDGKVKLRDDAGNTTVLAGPAP